MAGWISSKLKVAESLLQQIDQQAAESLGKSAAESLSPTRAAGAAASTKSILKISDSSRPLKYQIPKKQPPSPTPQNAADPLPPTPARATAALASPPPSMNPQPPAVADGDWTELLSSASSPAAPIGGGGGKKIAGAPLRKGVRKGSGPVGGGGGARAGKKADVSSESEVKNSVKEQKSPPSSGLSASRRSSSILKLTKELLIHEFRAGADHDSKPANLENVGVVTGEIGKSMVSVDGKQGGGAESISNSLNTSKNKFVSGSESDSDSDSTSSTDSEEERQRREDRRRRMEQVRAERMAAIAAEAIKERENLVARLEGEKLSLEKILMERQKKQAQEATELQMNMIETMEAVDVEKQRHNSTMMEALSRLAELEVKNAELAKLLATTQRNLEAEVSRVGDLRQQIELKELAQEEHKKNISKMHQSTSSIVESESLRRSQLEHEILGAEFSLICDKLEKLKGKAKYLEENIEKMRKEVDYPSEVEVELKKRLDQLTDRLIQKQTQVEALSSEKAMLTLRIEMVSKLLDESEFSSQTPDPAGIDIEAGTWGMPSTSTLRPLIHDRIRTGKQQLGSILGQLDSISSAGVIYLRRNKNAQLWALLYLVCLHLWVLYILMSKSQVPNADRSSAVYSLETINKTSS